MLAVDDGWLVVSTGTNEIVRVALDGSIHPVWKGVDAPDACHVNCVTSAGGNLWASAFGWFPNFKGWRGTSRRPGTGVLWNIETGEELGGLSHPHTPRFVDGDWLVCESIAHALVRRDRKGVVVERVRARRLHVRAVHVADGRVLVGVSAKRAGDATDAHVARARPRHVHRRRPHSPFPAPRSTRSCSVPDSLVEGLRTGFATNAHRVALGARLEQPATGGRALLGAAARPSGVRVPIVATLPSTVRAADAWIVDVEVDEHRHGVDSSSRPPHPVFVASRWIGTGGQQIDGDRVPLPDVSARTVDGARVVPLAAPAAARTGSRSRSCTKRRLWFDEIDPAYGLPPSTLVSCTAQLLWSSGGSSCSPKCTVNGNDDDAHGVRVGFITEKRVALLVPVVHGAFVGRLHAERHQVRAVEQWDPLELEHHLAGTRFARRDRTPSSDVFEPKISCPSSSWIAMPNCTSSVGSFDFERDADRHRLVGEQPRATDETVPACSNVTFGDADAVRCRRCS